MESGPANGRSPQSDMAQRGTKRFPYFGTDCATAVPCDIYYTIHVEINGLEVKCHVDHGVKDH